jgi:hypothetical protein
VGVLVVRPPTEAGSPAPFDSCLGGVTRLP